MRCTTVGYTQYRKAKDRGLRRVLPARPNGIKPDPLAVREPTSSESRYARFPTLGFFQVALPRFPWP